MGQPAPGPKGERGERGPQGPKGEDGKDGKDGTVSWNALSQDQKDEIMNGLKKFPEFVGPRGPQGDQGPPGKNGIDGKDGKDGKDGVSDPEQIITKLLGTNQFMTDLGDNIAKKSTELSSNVAIKLGGDPTARTLISTELSTIPEFRNAIVEKLTTDDTYKRRIKGDPGDITNPAALKTALIDKTMWCADGNICDLPKDKNLRAGAWIEAGGGVRVRGNKIVFNNDPDMNHGIQKIDNPDGPFVHGYAGGALGTVKHGTRHALKWGEDNNVELGNALMLPHGWKIEPNASGLRFYKDNQQKFVIHNNGEPWGEYVGYLVGARQEYEIGTPNGKYCIDAGSTGQGCDWNSDWRRFRIRQKGKDAGYFNS